MMLAPYDAVWVFWTRGSGPVSWAISRVTGAPPSHVGVAFGYEATGPAVYFEAHASTNWQSHSWHQIEAWARGDARRKLWVQHIPATPMQIEAMYAEALSHLDSADEEWEYRELQLLLLYLWIRLRIPLRRTVRRVVCSETVGVILLPVVDLAADMGLPSVEYLTPANIYLYYNPPEWHGYNQPRAEQSPPGEAARGRRAPTSH